MSYFSELESRKVIMFCGGGGVGKTSLAAATALGLALRGRRVVVMTIDPARRLMDALGLPPSGTATVGVDLGGLPASQPGGSLKAFMLSPRETIDALLRRLTGDSAAFERIRSNTLYQVAAGPLAGNIEYIALGKLYELVLDEDLIVVDTAPNQHALDFFESPDRLLRFFDAKVLRGLLSPLDRVTRLTGRLGGGLAERIERSFGVSFFSEVSQFLHLFEGLYDDFRGRALQMHQLLRDQERTRLMLAGVPTPVSLRDVAALHRELHRLGLPIGGVLMNRVHPPECAVEWHPPSGGAPEERLARRLIDGIRQVRTLAGYERERVRTLRFSLGEELPLWTVPYIEGDVSDLPGLARIAQELER